LNAGSKQFRELLSRDRAAEIVPLRFVAMAGAKEFQLLSCFNTLRDDAQLEALGHADHRGHNRGILASGTDLADKRLIDFEGIERKSSQITQAGIARAEIVHGHLYPNLSQALQGGYRGLGMF